MANVRYPGTAGTTPGTITASDVTYDNTTSGLTADDVQEAIDEIEGQIGSLSYDASDISYDNTTSGLTADDVQEALDEIDGNVDTINTALSSKMSYADNNILGAKNFLPNKITSQTINGVTFTVNADRSITANGTFSEQNAILISGTWSETDINFPVGNYCILSGGISHINIALSLYDSNNTLLFTMETGYSGGESTPTLIPSNVHHYSAYLYNDGLVEVNGTIKPMLRLATDTDDTYVPYAKTNRELSERKFDLLNSSTTLEGVITLPIDCLYKYNYLVVQVRMVENGAENGLGNQIMIPCIQMITNTGITNICAGGDSTYSNTSMYIELRNDLTVPQVSYWLCWWNKTTHPGHTWICKVYGVK